MDEPTPNANPDAKELPPGNVIAVASNKPSIGARIRNVFTKKHPWSVLYSWLFNEPRKPGCIEAAYAGLYAVSLVLLIIAFWYWKIKLIEAGSSLDKKTQFVEKVIWWSIFASIFQFSRIYHYIHEFDRCQDEKKCHFIAGLKKGYLILDRLFRGLAGLCVIFMVEKWGAHKLIEHEPGSKPPDYNSLISFPILLAIIFGLLLFWDINLLVWRWRGGENSLTKVQKDTLRDYHPVLKLIQRILGLSFSLLLFWLLLDSNDPSRPFWFGISLGLFGLAWLVDYCPPRWRIWDTGRVIDPNTNWFFELKSSISTFFAEFFSPLITIIHLFQTVRSEDAEKVNTRLLEESKP